jgi:outer membrane protein assembly factor BamD (BamD/ComL family)
MAGIQFRENQYDLSRRSAQKLLTDFPESIYADRMTKLIADTYFEEKNIPEAIRFYTEILVKYPGSIYLHEARARIRLLRQENI